MQAQRMNLAAAVALMIGGGAVLAVPAPANATELPVSGSGDVVINEIESSGGQPGDWLELFNPSTKAIDLEGYVLTDNSPEDPTHRYTVPAGTVVAAGAHLVIEDGESDLGLGGADSVRLFGTDGTTVVDEYSWSRHAATTYGRCPDGTGEFARTAVATKGSANVCADAPTETPGPTNPESEPWPGSPAASPIASGVTLAEDMSGLDYQYSPEGSTLWAVENGTGGLYRFDVAADGGVTPAQGWETPKRVRFQADAGQPDAAGPDTEGVTFSPGRPDSVFVGAERDNSAKSTNRNTILEVDVRAATGADVVATTEWDLTESLPAVEANTGIEAIEWVADSELDGKLLDENTGTPYDSANYPGANGLFFVAVEETAGVYAYALFDDGSAARVATLESGLGGVMALDYDESTQTLWGMCDNGCGGTSALFHFGTTDGSAGYTVTLIARPAGLPDTNNEGFTIAANETCTNGTRAAYWLEDGVQTDALKQGSIACAPVGTPPSETPGATETPGGTETPAPTGSPVATDTQGATPSPGGAAGGGQGSGTETGAKDEALATTGAAHLVPGMLAGLAALTLGALALTRRRDA
ncbi:lamin tail domain-containing protein [Pseudoclavibacter terrae]|uniref:Lamin tail domain-containing protein n=1 Tax=Pseudoclavibacter terrae TaxID=1530195 RepID=A0A7J5B539_9MICO|nr:lamin tail domain-containing protein [Pseudoclavibacter terrae]KAB1639299.1 lamin tail domain-containing protein [Pseudoclavibacter terrae]